MNIFALTPHQLDVIRTLASLIGGVGGLAGGVAAIFSFLARYWAKQAAQQTRSAQWVNGKLRHINVTEYAKHGATVGEATRQEVSDFRTEWVRGNGRRRIPTMEIPMLDQESTYE